MRLVKIAVLFAILFGTNFAVAPPAVAASCGAACSCTVSGAAIALTGYDPVGGAPVVAAGTVSVGCQLLSALGSVSVPYQLNFSSGQAGSFAPRKMTGPSGATLSYNLYSDAGMTTVWGDGSGGSSGVASAVGLSLPGITVSVPMPVYARLPGGQNVPLGSYSDSVTATLQF